MKKHESLIDEQFTHQAEAYRDSAIHASGADLDLLPAWVTNAKHVLDLGCGAGHVSFLSAQYAQEVTAYDLSDGMLSMVQQTAQEKQLNNITTAQGYAESLPFESGIFDVVISRYSAHHWRDVNQALHEAYRVLSPNGKLIMMDIVSPGHVILDSWLQMIEKLRDPSHARNYANSEWLAMFAQSGFQLEHFHMHRIHLSFDSWIKRMQTPPVLVDAIRHLQKQSSGEVSSYFQLKDDGSFSEDATIFMVQKMI